MTFADLPRNRPDPLQPPLGILDVCAREMAAAYYAPDGVEPPWPRLGANTRERFYRTAEIGIIAAKDHRRAHGGMTIPPEGLARMLCAAWFDQDADPIKRRLRFGAFSAFERQRWVGCARAMIAAGQRWAAENGKAAA